MPGRSFSAGSKYRYGFNGQENSDEIAAGLTTAMYWEYDSRIGRRWNVEPLIAKYPNLSSYVSLGNNPISMIDPNGEDIIFVNGYRAGGTASAYPKSKEFQNKLKDKYWNSVNKGFTGEVERYFNDKTEHFITGDHYIASRARDRIQEGKEVGIMLVTSGEIKVSNTNNIMTIVMHSQGNAEGVGIAMGIIEQAKKQGVDITVNLVFLAVHQPDGIDKKMSADLKKRGIQFTYANDDAIILQPQGKISGVVDANAENKKWKKGGLKAHSAPIDDTSAFEAIKKTDQEKKIFVGKPIEPKK